MKSRLFGFGTALIAAGLLLTGKASAQSFNTVLSSNLFQPTGIAVSPDNAYVITDSSNHRIVEYNADTRVFRVLAGGEAGAADGTGPDARLRNPQGIVAVSDGYVFADSGNHLIRHLSPEGVVTTLAGSVSAAAEANPFAVAPWNQGAADGIGAAASFNSPSWVAWDGADTIYITDTLNGSLRSLRLSDRQVTTLLTGLSMPTAAAVGDDGTIYIAETGTHSILAYKDGELTVLAGRRSPFESGYRDSTTASQGLLRSPRGLYLRASKNELMVVDSGNQMVRRIYNLSSNPGIDTFANSDSAGFHNPVGIARDKVGMFVVIDKEASQIRGVTTDMRPRVPDPRIGRVIYVVDPITGVEQAIFEEVTDATFETPQQIVITGDGEAHHFYTFGEGPAIFGEPDTVPAPDNDSENVALNFISPTSRLVAQDRSLNIDPLPVLVIKTISYDRDEPERVPSRVVKATFRFQVAAPIIDTTSVPGSVVISSVTPDVSIWYTLNGEDPVNDPSNPNMHLIEDPESNPIPLPIGQVLKVRGYRNGFAPSPIITKSDFIPVYISLGYPTGEGSSDFIGAAGQRFYAPVTLTAPPNISAHGLQFSLSVTNALGTVGPDGATLAFESMLFEKLPERDAYEVIPPSTVIDVKSNIIYFSEIVTNTNAIPPVVFTNQVPVATNLIPIITNLLSTNTIDRLLMVGWVQRTGILKEYSIYPTESQNLFSYSIMRDRVYEGENGKIIPGAFSFVVPSEAPAGTEYWVRVDRPSATADGLARDIFVKPVDPEDIENEEDPAFGLVPSVRKMVVGSRVYRVGDVAPFRWYNAGEFGDTNLFNNDLMQLHQSIAYRANMPPPGSDFEDAMDSCCLTINHEDLGLSLDAQNGDDLDINDIAFGDGRLDVADLFVTFRRGLDPSLVWYGRYWSNGVRHAVIVPNEYRGETGWTVPLPSESDLAGASVSPFSDLLPRAVLKVASASAVPGQALSLPVTLRVDGPHPARTLMFSVTVETLEGGVPFGGTLSFNSTGAFGAPTLTDNSVGGRFSAAWLNPSIAGLAGEQVIGYLHLTVPQEALPNSLFRVKVETISASPNGFAVLPSDSIHGTVVISNRPASNWGDGITDEWRAQFFGQVYSPESHPEFDPDSDGVPNRLEFAAGTSPVDPADRLKLELRRGPGRALQLSWPTVKGKRYLLESSPALGNAPWTPVTSSLDGTGAPVTFDEGGTATQFYYRIRVVE